ncbi:MAG: hypothetical protein RQ885_13445 [Desulfurococcales archaeon]|nr:hypothetical protein [Desulfurococcales archaeon]
MNRQEIRRYDLEAWLHVNFYKIASIYSIIEALAIIAYLASPSSITETIFRVSTIIYWATLTPSFYELTKGFLMIYSRGAVYSHIAENIRERLVKRYSLRASLARSALYIAIILWIIAPIAFIVGWFYG